MKGPKLYQLLSEKQLNKFLKTLGTSTDQLQTVEIKDPVNDLYGDFICIADFKFKLTYGSYQCLQTPTEKHVKKVPNGIKAQTDYYKR